MDLRIRRENRHVFKEKENRLNICKCVFFDLVQHFGYNINYFAKHFVSIFNYKTLELTDNKNKRQKKTKI